ncbi:hypothetical protein [Pyxidicoccus sp. MSG2]|uniref:hypothetical protein n=1 Tax=Pyxidicoccus sp. MSG2 TaxID=2996790 RepID=UPI00226F5BC8|nr:hypothetical protein [Pyxidicoccus sp. MSG2]MCY1016189.1 hypothetical protein [Pyxidicoccus sp. MSG2]
MSKQPFGWKFREPQEDEVIQDATEAEFFKQDEDLPDAVVRELIQNSLDAAISRAERVRVDFKFSGAKYALPPERARRWFESLQPYLEFADKVPSGFLSESLPFLSIEDFGTRGLGGDPKQSWDTLDKNDFYMFWRNVGRSSKKEGDRGRWGLGKAVNHEASGVSSFFGITRRLADDALLLMGRSVLQFRVTKEQRYDPRGWFGWSAENKPGTLIMPVANAETLDQFCSDFHLSRKERHGFSLVIPLPKEKLTHDAVARAVVENYFHAVLTGKLEVRVRDGDEEETVIDASTIYALAQRFVTKEGPGLAKIFELAKWGHDLPEEEYVGLGEVGQQPPAWSLDVFAPASESRSELRERFQSNGRIAFRLPIAVKRVKAESIRTSLAHVYLERVSGAGSTDETRGRTIFVREGMAVPMVRLSHERTVRALLVVDTQPLSALLGDAENPMHTDWLQRNDKLLDRNTNGPATVSYVKNAVREITRWLTEVEDQKREDLLMDLFYVEEPGPGVGVEENQEEEPKKKKRRKKKLKKHTGPKAPTPYSVKPIKGGFEVTPVEGLVAPPRIVIRAAYDARDSSPFEAYRPHDFIIDSGELKVEAKGAEYTANLNSLIITVKKQNFRVTVTGFDTRRDLRVEGRKATGDEP